MSAARPSLLRRLGRLLPRGLGLVAPLLVAAWLWARPATPDAFLGPPADLPAEPGRLLGAEPFTRALPDGAWAIRILYTTRRQDGSPAVASALVYLPEDAAGPLPVIAWAHGTTGVARGCAPSMFADPLLNVPAGAIAAPDSALTPDLVGWTRDRFAGRPAPDSCPR